MQKKLYGYCLAVVLLVLAGCSSQVPVLRQKLDASVTCCDSYLDIDYRRFNGKSVTFTLHKPAQVRRFPNGPSYFKAIILPDVEADQVIEFNSSVVGTDLNVAHVLYPQFIFLDKDKNPTRRFIAGYRWNMNFFSGGHALQMFVPRKKSEKYLLIYSDYNLMGETVNLTVENTGYTMPNGNGGIIYVPGTGTHTYPIPLADSGKLKLSLLDSLPDNVGSGIGESVPFLRIENYTLPEHIGNHDLVASQVYDDPFRGFNFTYSEYRDGFDMNGVDMFVYPVINGAYTGRELLTEEFRRSLQSLSASAQSQRVNIIGKPELEDQTIAGLASTRLAFAADVDGERYETKWYLAVKDDVYIKLRWTKQPNEPAFDIEQFWSEFLAAQNQ